MNKRHFLPLLLAAALALTACGGDDNDSGNSGSGGTTTDTSNTNKNDASKNAYLSRLEFPHIKGGTSTVIVHETSGYGVNYCTEYDLTLRSQRWSCYATYQSNNVKNWKRANWDGAYWSGKTWHTTNGPFQPDPAIDESLQAGTGEYRSGNSNYARGHIVASADRLMSMDANGQTFYMTNMQPMIDNFNEGVWQQMESFVQKKCPTTNSTDTLYVVKGGTIDDAQNVLAYTTNGFIVPKYFYMALLLRNSSGYRAMGFWIEHKAGNSTTLSDYVVTIDQLEQKTGIDFFCNLPDATENYVEGLALDKVKSAWGFK